jgi:microcystin-dependent protein
MSQPYVGEIRMFAGNFAPAGWAFCDGSLLPIAEFETLFNLIGTTYGGDGQTSFALPDLRSRLPNHMGNGFVLAQTGGAETVTLNTQQIPSHTHALLATASGQVLSPSSTAVPAQPTSAQAGTNIFDANAPATMLNAASIGLAGGNGPHDNMHPFLVVNFIISEFGVFPSQT